MWERIGYRGVGYLKGMVSGVGYQSRVSSGVGIWGVGYPMGRVFQG